MFLYNGLRRTPAFAVFLPEELIDLADAMSIRLHPDTPTPVDWPHSQGAVEMFAADRVILHQGEHVNDDSKFYLVRAGRIEVRQSMAGSERIISSLTKGDVFGERALLKALIDTDVPRNASLVTREPTVLYTMTLRHLRDLIVEWGRKPARQVSPILADLRPYLERIETGYR
jgi:putative ABC transport system ATP-binding protein